MLMPTSRAVNSAFEVATVTLISTLIFLSVVSLFLIFHLQFKSKSLKHLKNFNSLWAVRFLLVFLISLWSLSELLRLPLIRHLHLRLFSFLSDQNDQVSNQVGLCKLHIILSLGFFQPAFLVTLLFLFNASIVTTAKNHFGTVLSVFLTCLPVSALHGILMFSTSWQRALPPTFRQAHVVVTDAFGEDTVLCTYPLLSSAVFAVFAIAYSACFLLSCWNVLSLVINKGLRLRIYGLSTALLFALPIQVVALGFTAVWTPESQLYGVFSLVVFLGAFVCAVTGEGFMVIKPISDALDAGASFYSRSGPRDGDAGEKEMKVAGGEDLV
ncbi:hypothetical protein HN51_031941 [Arachis hypogaea]|uniref:Uncharacterized protein n=2 Tax=Arachis TaxID=3817 RepID=A0A445B6J7_ARAHY|nr:uncharacterized protein DS421_10g301750 [Arachis hypogaea]RYR34271.1 hypothetical protein Ahy_A10g049046 [Arachis hypogaea]